VSSIITASGQNSVASLVRNVCSCSAASMSESFGSDWYNAVASLLGIVRDQLRTCPNAVARRTRLGSAAVDLNAS
jgi:hypothetical protein